MTRYKNMKNGAKKVVMKAMKEATERKLRELSEHPNKVFKLVKSMKKDGKDVEGGGSDSRLNFSKKDRGRVWKEHMERIMNEENEWHQNVQADLVEGPVSGAEGEVDVSKVDPCGICGKQILANSVLCVKCRK